MPSQAYFEVDGEGDWYAAIATTNPGESPLNTPEKWVKLPILDIFEEYLVEQAVSYLLGPDALDKKRAQSRDTVSTLDDLAWRHATHRGDFVQPEVRSR